MKWMVASDVHGSAYYSKLLIENFERERADKLLLLGDILYHGPRNALPKDYNPQAVAEQFNCYKSKIIALRGNCDSEVDQMVLDFPILSDYACIDIGGKMIFATHGHLFNENNLPPLTVGDIFLYGHIHVPVNRTINGIVCMNPGSVSIPKSGSENSYMTIENGIFKWKNMQGISYMQS